MACIISARGTNEVKGDEVPSRWLKRKAESGRRTRAAFGAGKNP